MIPRNERKQLRAVIYTRVAAEADRGKRGSLRVQANRCRAYARKRGWRIVKVVSDPGYSGVDMRRPGIAVVRDLINGRQIDVLIVYRLDRLSRSLRHTLSFVDDELTAKEVSFVSVSEPLDMTSVHGRVLFEILGTADSPIALLGTLSSLASRVLSPSMRSLS